MIRRANMSEAKHLVPRKSAAIGGVTHYRDAVEGETANLEVDRVAYRCTVIIEEDDPYTAAMFFREIRRATGQCDINDVQCRMTFDLSGMTEEELANLNAMLEMSWSCVSPGLPVVERIYYKEKTR